MSTSNFVKGECRQCGGHLEFPTDAGGETVPCPHCGQPTELVATISHNTNRRWMWPAIIIGLAFCLAGLASAILLKNKSKHIATPSEKIALPTSTNQSPARVVAPVGETMNDFTITDIKLEKSLGNSLVYATGKILNTSNRRRFGVKVELNLLDADTNSLGKTKDYHALLEPGAEWHFKAMVMKPKAVSVRLASILEDQ